MFLSATAAHPQQLLQTFYVPLPETQARIWADAIQDLAENETIHSVISITITTDGTEIHYDQWENGFEADLENPAALFTGAPNDPGTQIWGDGDLGNGCPPNLNGLPNPCLVAADDQFAAGDVIVLESDVPLGATNTRDPAQVFFDGGDKLGSTQLLAVTRAAWPSTGVQAQLGGAVEVFDTSEWGNGYESPLGINQGLAAFEFVGASILARSDLTRVSVDANADGDFTDPGDVLDLILSEGESILVQDLVVGAEIVSDGLVEVSLLTANEATTYEGRWYSLIPTSTWGSSYYSPVGTTQAANPTHAYIYNPDPTGTITVTEDTLLGTTTFTVGPGAVVERLLPANTPTSAAHYFTAGGEPFYAVAATDRNNTIHDWGYTLIPESRLTIRAAVGWAPGSTNLTENASPIWVTPVADATFDFDCDGDGTPEFTQFVQALESYQLFIGAAPPAGCTAFDATGLQISAVDAGLNPVKFAAAWGQDPGNAASGQPQ
ncbi:MAG: hypothetical protein GY778_20950, partial [bacterium]|nr:hypothetical protein [bacterium]